VVPCLYADRHEPYRAVQVGVMQTHHFSDAPRAIGRQLRCGRLSTEPSVGRHRKRKGLLVREAARQRLLLSEVVRHVDLGTYQPVPVD